MLEIPSGQATSTQLAIRAAVTIARGDMAVDRRSFAKSLGGVVSAALGGASRPTSASAQAPAAAAAARTAGRLAPAKVTRNRLFYPQN
jgi:hypothetical protein